MNSKITTQTIRALKNRGEKIAALTAYDFPMAKLLGEAGVPIILVGDSLAMTVLGHDNTLSLTVDEMLHHARAVRRGVRSSFLVVDMPYGSYHSGTEDALRNAMRFAAGEFIEQLAELFRRDAGALINHGDRTLPFIAAPFDGNRCSGIRVF